MFKLIRFLPPQVSACSCKSPRPHSEEWRDHFSTEPGNKKTRTAESSERENKLSGANRRQRSPKQNVLFSPS